MSQHTIPVVICSIVLHAFWLRKVSHSASTACSKN
jgi:hypothetical protein